MRKAAARWYLVVVVAHRLGTITSRKAENERATAIFGTILA